MCLMKQSLLYFNLRVDLGMTHLEVCSGEESQSENVLVAAPKGALA